MNIQEWMMVKAQDVGREVLRYGKSSLTFALEWSMENRMKNVYAEVQSFYKNHGQGPVVISRKWVEGYLRRRAWQGLSDMELRNCWIQLQLLELFVAEAALEEPLALEDLAAAEYGHFFIWMDRFLPGISEDYEKVRECLSLLKDFYQYLLEKGYIADWDELRRASEAILHLEKLELFPQSLQMDLEEESAGETGEKPSSSQKVGHTLEQLMQKLGHYFQQKQFSHDFQRALMLYTGPIEVQHSEDDYEFWLGFWDYFLFDYRLLYTDQHPLEHFFSKCKQELGEGQMRLMDGLRQARFSLFYVEKRLTAEQVLCKDLLTEQEISMPIPPELQQSMKQVLFFGHVFAHADMSINYVTHVKVSKSMRRRIRQELEQQCEIYRAQWPKASWEDFLDRHALLVRHTLRLLVNQTQWNMTGAIPPVRKLQPGELPLGEMYDQVTKQMEKLLLPRGFSVYDLYLLSTLWKDYCQLRPVNRRRPQIWAGGLLLAFVYLNRIHLGPLTQLAKELGATAVSLKNASRDIIQTLELREFEPRYLNEEGFVMALFSTDEK